MKVKELNQKKESFTPIKLEITIESYQELCNLWHRMNTSVSSINKSLYSTDYIKQKCKADENVLFHVLDEIAIKLNNQRR